MIKVFGSKVGTEELSQVADSVQKQWLGAGPKVQEFEKKFRQKINASNFLMIDNASNGLFLACKLLDIPAGSEIILPSFTYVACVHAVVMAGFKPVFCDVSYESQNISVELIKPHISSKTGAIMVVHYAGLPVDMSPIIELGFPIIEDAAHAVNSFYNGQHCGTIGDIGVFSFDSMKNLAVGEGGGITCRSLQYFDRANNLRLSGVGSSSFDQSGNNRNRWWEQQASEAFIKMKPSDIIAGFGIAQLAKLNNLQTIRRNIWYRYQAELNDIGDLELPLEANKNSQHSYFTFCIKTTKRDQLARYLYKKGIYTTLRFFPVHLINLYRTGTRLVNTERLNETALNIPLHPDLTDIEIESVIYDIQDFFS